MFVFSFARHSINSVTICVSLQIRPKVLLPLNHFKTEEKNDIPPFYVYISMHLYTEIIQGMCMFRLIVSQVFASIFYLAFTTQDS